jgi:hypothetical protein
VRVQANRETEPKTGIGGETADFPGNQGENRFAIRRWIELEELEGPEEPGPMGLEEVGPAGLDAQGFEGAPRAELDRRIGEIQG